MRSIQRFFYFRKYFNQRKRGFTLLEVAVALCLLGVFGMLLMSFLYQVVQFVGGTSERTRQCQQVRKFCEVLTADCRKLFLSPIRDAMELDASSRNNGEFSLFLLRQFTSGWEHAFISQTHKNATCMALVQYRFDPKKGVISRHIWRLEEAPQIPSATPAGGMRLQDVLPQEDAFLSRNLVQNVAHFELYALDVLGQRQTQWMQGSSKGLEYEVTFCSVHQHPRSLQKFYARIPIPRMGEE